LSRPYGLTLIGDWAEVASDDPEQRHFESKEKDAGLIVSSILTNFHDTERLAQQFTQFRMEAESLGADEFDYHVTIAEPIIEPRPWGHATGYYGSDSNGRQFSFSAAVTSKQIVSLYISSRSLTEKELAAEFQMLLAGLRLEGMQPE